MAAKNSAEQTAPPDRTFGQAAKRAALFVLFGTMLMIPRIRRARRRVWAWTCIRMSGAVFAGLLIWRYERARVGVGALALALALLAFSLLVRASSAEKSPDALARELNALIVLNGGTFRQSPASTPVGPSQIFVCTDQIIVMGPRERRLLEIPTGMVRSLTARPVAKSRKGFDSWQVEVQWLADEARSTTFRYDGAFAEHLARVTESILRSQWKRGLPVIQI
jgi:hypothetical protein